MNTTSTLSRSSVTRLLSAVRDDVRGARQARAAHRDLKRELSSYTTASEVNDLLASLDGQEGADAEAIRQILTDNLWQRPRQLAA